MTDLNVGAAFPFKYGDVILFVYERESYDDLKAEGFPDFELMCSDMPSDPECSVKYISGSSINRPSHVLWPLDNCSGWWYEDNDYMVLPKGSPEHTEFLQWLLAQCITGKMHSQETLNDCAIQDVFEFCEEHLVTMRNKESTS